MKNVFKKITAPILGGALIAIAGLQQANAATVSYSASMPSQLTDINYTLYLPQFNLSLGQLTSVDVVFSSNYNTKIDVVNHSDTASSGSVNTQITFTLTGPTTFGTVVHLPQDPDLGTDIITYSLAAGQSSGWSDVYFDSTSLSKTYTATKNPSVLTAYSGTGNVGIAVKTVTATQNTNTGGNTGFDQDTNADSSVEVTYTYDPTATPPDEVPEPATWAMLLGGVGMLSFGQRLRHRL